MRRPFLALLVLLCVIFCTIAPTQAQFRSPQVQVTTALNFDALHPNQQAVLAVVIDIPAGLHAQSRVPSNPNFIRFDVKNEPNAAIRFLSTQYPPGRDEMYPNLGKLNVYTGPIRVYIPFEINPNAAIGDLTIAGSVTYQLCDDRVCFPPQNAAFSFSTRIVSIDEPVHPNTGQAELFGQFDPTVFSHLTPPATFQFLSWSFSLDQTAYPAAFSIAFIVGILFNLMPCVLPVVPLKAIGFYNAAQHNRLRSLVLGTVFTAGLLSAFAILAVAVVVYNHAWGQQFSNPWFVWAMVVVLIVLAFGMFGTFDVVLPASVYQYTPSHETILGNFLFGAFTALLSTPCTAPMFVGLLVWAGKQPQWLGVTTVMIVGLGMGSPYLLLSAFPELARRFPRSGPWSLLIKQMMGFLLLAVAVYFAAGRLIEGRDFFWAVFAVLAAASVFLVARTVQLAGRVRPIAISSGIAILLAGGSLLFTLNLTGAWRGGQHELIAWQPYTPGALAEARQGGKVVLVEFTANWCSNCIELEARVFNDPRAAEALTRHGVVSLRADLSREDAAGWDLLRQLTPSGGIPLTVIYPAGRSEPIQLSSIYTTQNLINALEEASSLRLTDAGGK